MCSKNNSFRADRIILASRIDSPFLSIDIQSTRKLKEQLTATYWYYYCCE